MAALTTAFIALIAQVPSLTLASTLPVDCTESGGTVTCTYTSGDNLFTVPESVTSVHVVAIGGKGAYLDGGHGARVEGDLVVTPSTSLHAVVGGNGDGYTGGFNGGGSDPYARQCWTGGGGATDIRSDSTLASRLLVAAGGGGAGCQTYLQRAPGGDADAAGTDGSAFGVTGGQAGCAPGLTTSCSGGGAGGSCDVCGSPGTAGTLGQGGEPGSGPEPGGGGGGGYYGGGGGGGNIGGGSGGGGGGGSNLVPTGGSVSLDTTGLPKIVISYDVSNLPAGCTESAGIVTCTYLSGDNLFTIPSGVTTISVVAVGGSGGAAGGLHWGAGARVAADLPVNPGDVLHAVVGGNGGSFGEAGANGGGFAGSTLRTGGGGGGASDIRTGAGLDTRVLVAGGGGGFGYSEVSAPSNGGDAGAPGAPADTSTVAGAGGLAGCSSAVDLTCGTGGLGATGESQPGSPGGAGSLGAGGWGGMEHGNLPATSQWGGGGGGGGLYGGGGGGSGAAVPGNRGTGGGGGGGSSLVPDGGTFAIDTTRTPKIDISFTVDVGTGPTPFKVVSATSTGSHAVDVTFDAAPDPTQATTLENYAIDGLTLSGTPSLVGTTVTLTTSAQSAQFYGVTVSNVTRASDAATLDWTSATFTGMAPAAASFDTTQVDFASQLVGTTSTATTITLTNSGGESLAVSTASLSGSDISEFATTANACLNTALAPGEQCQVQVVFKPTTTGPKAATLRFTDSAGDSPQDVGLAGLGTLPGGDVAVRIAAAPGAPKVGRALRYTITISNAGPSAATGIVLADALPSQAIFISASPSAGACGAPLAGTITCTIPSIAAGAKVTIQILVTVGANGILANAVSVTTASVDPNLANNLASTATRVK